MAVFLQKESLLSSFLAVEKEVARTHHLQGPRGWNFETKGGTAQVTSGNTFVVTAHFIIIFYPPTLFKETTILNKHLQHGK